MGGRKSSAGGTLRETLLIVFIISSISSLGFCIKCWVCTSNVDPKCSDPFDNSSLPITDCNEFFLDHLKSYDNGSVRGAYDELLDRYSNRFPADSSSNSGQRVPTPKDRSGKGLLKSTMCRKIRQKVEGEWRTIRGCAILGEPGEGTGTEHHCLIKRGTWDIYIEYCTCNSKDGCNAGMVSKPSLTLLFAFLTFCIGMIAFRKSVT